MDLSWAKEALKYLAAAAALALCYLLSFGPVVHLWAKQTVTRTANSTTTTTILPPWVSKIYLPAFYFSATPGFGRAYSSYVNLWSPGEKPTDAVTQTSK